MVGGQWTFSKEVQELIIAQTRGDLAMTNEEKFEHLYYLIQMMKWMARYSVEIIL